MQPPLIDRVFCAITSKKRACPNSAITVQVADLERVSNFTDDDGFCGCSHCVTYIGWISLSFHTSSLLQPGESVIGGKSLQIK
jgi:hypothetical protein